MPTNTPNKTVHLIRHGQSVDNAAPVFQAADSPLSEQGIEQAEFVAERLSHVEFEALLSSPLPRARQTAEHVAAKTGKQPEFNEILQERIKPSATDGKPWSDKAANALFTEWTHSLFSENVRAEDGENYHDIVTRADQALELLRQRTETSLVVVTHGFFMKVMLARILIGSELTPTILKTFNHGAMVENTSITTVRYVYDAHQDRSAWRMWGFNDHSHFAE